jgi:hypothetical protein
MCGAPHQAALCQGHGRQTDKHETGGTDSVTRHACSGERRVASARSATRAREKPKAKCRIGPSHTRRMLMRIHLTRRVRAALRHSALRAPAGHGAHTRGAHSPHAARSQYTRSCSFSRMQCASRLVLAWSTPLAESPSHGRACALGGRGRATSSHRHSPLLNRTPRHNCTFAAPRLAAPAFSWATSALCVGQRRCARRMRR